MIEPAIYTKLTEALGEGCKVFYAIPDNETPLPFAVFYVNLVEENGRETGELRVDLWTESGKECLEKFPLVKAIQGNHTGYSLVWRQRNTVPNDDAALLEIYFEVR